MMNPRPPSPVPMAELFALIALIKDPDAVKSKLEELNTATAEYTVAVGEHNAKLAEIAKREAAVAEAEKAAADKESKAARKADAAEQRAQASKEEAARVRADIEQLRKERAEFNEFKARVQRDFNTRSANLALSEKTAAEALESAEAFKAEYEGKLAQIKALAG